MVNTILAPQPLRFKQKSLFCCQDIDDGGLCLKENLIRTIGESDHFEKSISSVTSFSPFNYFYADEKVFLNTEPINRSNIEKSKLLSSLSEDFNLQSLLKVRKLGFLRLNLARCNRVKPIAFI